MSHFQCSANTLLEIVDHSFHLETLFSLDFWDLTLFWFLLVPLTPFSVSFIHPFPLPNFPAIVSQDSAMLHLFSLTHSSLYIQSHGFKYIPCSVVTLIYFLSWPSTVDSRLIYPFFLKLIDLLHFSCPKPNFWFSPEKFPSLKLPYLSKWQLHSPSCLGPKPGHHSRLLSLTPHLVLQLLWGWLSLSVKVPHLWELLTRPQQWDDMAVSFCKLCRSEKF